QAPAARRAVRRAAALALPGLRLPPVPPSVPGAAQPARRAGLARLPAPPAEAVPWQPSVAAVQRPGAQLPPAARLRGSRLAGASAASAPPAATGRGSPRAGAPAW